MDSNTEQDFEARLAQERADFEAAKVERAREAEAASEAARAEVSAAKSDDQATRQAGTALMVVEDEDRPELEAHQIQLQRCVPAQVSRIDPAQIRRFL